MNRTVCSAVAWGLVCGAIRADVELVRDGRPVSEIVIAENAEQGIKLAAEDLREHIERMSGARLPLVNAPSAGTKNQVYVGQSRFTKALGFVPAAFNSSGLEIVARANYIILDGPNKHWRRTPYGQTPSDTAYLKGSVITGDAPARPADFPSPGLKAWQDFCGRKFTTQHLNNAPGDFNAPLQMHVNDDPGPWYAVAELLEQLGVRWYMPYEIGTVIPARKTIRVPEQHLRREAAFDFREWCYYRARGRDGDGIAWLKRLKAGNYRSILLNHTTYAIYSSYEQQQLHPEYLACDKDGKPYRGYPPGRGMPRYTDPGFREAAVIYMNKVFESQPELWAMSVGAPDGGVRMDARDLPRYGKADDSVEQKASNYVWDFHVHLCKALARSHPDKYLIYFSGQGAGEIPTNVSETPPNLLRRMGILPSSSWVLERHREGRLARVRQWMAATGATRWTRSPSWDHWLYYRNPSYPRYPVVFTRALQEQTKAIKPYVAGKFIEIQPASLADARPLGEHDRLGVPGLVHLMVYWQNRLFWDENADRAAMLDEYYRLFFGPAESEMREFYEFAEAVWSRPESRSITPTSGFLKAADVDRYFEILTRARAKAGDGTVYGQRVALIETEMQSLKKLFPNLQRSGPWIRAYPTPANAEVDGEVDDYSRYGWTTMRGLRTGEKPGENQTRVAFSLPKSRSALRIGVVCYENDMAGLKADTRTDDAAAIFRDDVVEIYIDTPQRSYFKIVVNPNNAVWTECKDFAIVDRDTLPILWNPSVQTAVKRYADRWTVEIQVPTDDFGEVGPTKTYPWGVQVGRSRWRDGRAQSWAIAPTDGGPFRTQNRWASLWMR
ncbi:MAG: DUF4838 domain-containing protein [Kiritimatiellae bacterium]|nr:DUF4838 domain-containing protein [Kiritimatiellia bacterium]